MSKRTIHLSNDLGTIEVDEFDGKVRVLDVPKAIAIYEANSDKKVYVGMKTDSYWTFNKIEKEDDITDYHCPITNWDTPVIEVDGETIDCYVEIPTHVKDTILNHDKLRKENRQKMQEFLDSKVAPKGKEIGDRDE